MTNPRSADLPPLPADLPETVARVLSEDLGSGDVTADLIPQSQIAKARVIAREKGVLCGTAWFDETFRQTSKGQVHIEWSAHDGQALTTDQVLATLTGPARAMLSAERTALNFLQTLSGTAYLSHRFANAVDGTGTRVLDTRKTIPGLRSAQKYAVRCGGCWNHRMGLYDMILIKENHIRAVGSIQAALQKARTLHPDLTLEVEVESLEELRQALDGGADIVLLDNFEPEDLAPAASLASGRCKLEVSGNVSLANVRRLAEAGVDYISVGALTKNVQATDLSLLFETP